MTRKPAIVLVEDDEQIATALEVVLRDEGYEISHVADGARGLALASASRCDLVLTDLRLPGLTGFELVKQLQQLKPRLPPYARPIFLRLSPRIDVTGTFKQRKIDLVREGFDPAAIADPLYWLDPATGSYEPLTPERYADIAEGLVKL